METNETQVSDQDNTATDTQTAGNSTASDETTTTDTNVNQNGGNSENDAATKTETTDDNSSENSDDSNSSETQDDSQDDFTKEFIGKPEKGYDYKDVKLPEGWTLDQEMLNEFNETAEKLDLSQKGADKFVSMQLKNAQKVAENVSQQIAKQQQEILQKRLDEQENVILKDSEIGGKNYDESKRIADLAYTSFIQKDKDADELFCKSGLINHPTVFKMFYNIGKQMEDGKVHDAGTPTGVEKSAAEILFGNSKEEKQDK